MLRRPLHTINITYDVRKKNWYSSNLYPLQVQGELLVNSEVSQAVLRDILNYSYLTDSASLSCNIGHCNIRELLFSFDGGITDISVNYSVSNAVLYDVYKILNPTIETVVITHLLGNGVIGNVLLSTHNEISAVTVAVTLANAQFTV